MVNITRAQRREWARVGHPERVEARKRAADALASAMVFLDGARAEDWPGRFGLATSQEVEIAGECARAAWVRLRRSLR